jgi:hypothetical protein
MHASKGEHPREQSHSVPAWFSGRSKFAARRPAVVRAEALMPIKVWRPPLRWRDGYLVLNGAELKISEFPDLFDAFGHHFGGR